MSNFDYFNGLEAVGIYDLSSGSGSDTDSMDSGPDELHGPPTRSMPYDRETPPTGVRLHESNYKTAGNEEITRGNGTPGTEPLRKRSRSSGILQEGGIQNRRTLGIRRPTSTGRAIRPLRNGGSGEAGKNAGGTGGKQPDGICEALPGAAGTEPSTAPAPSADTPMRTILGENGYGKDEIGV